MIKRVIHWKCHRKAKSVASIVLWKWCFVKLYNFHRKKPAMELLLEKPTCLQMHWGGRHRRPFPVKRFCECNFLVHFTQVSAETCSTKWVFLGVSGNFWENTGATIFFLVGLHSIGPAALLGEGTLAWVFYCGFYENVGGILWGSSGECF